ncbi:unnamed protein product [Dicrocoelium dendriticum]|nr:unnamed protein product [Dicrocoelium dendriticum]
MQDRFLKILRAMVAFDENRFCFDCHQRGPTYVNITIGSFVCTGCGGALRKYSHRVKSMSMSNFSPAEMEFLRRRGNKACRKIFLALSDDQSLDERELSDAARDDYLREKYQLRKWYREPTAELEAAAIQENQQIIDQADQNISQRNPRTTCTNAASGLIIPAQRPPLSKASAPFDLTVKPPDIQQRVGQNGVTVTQPSVDPFAPSQQDPPKTNSSAVVSDPFGPPASSGSTQPPFTDLFTNFLGNSFPSSSTPSVPRAMQPASYRAGDVSGWPGTAFLPQPPATSQTFQANSSMCDKYAALAELDGLFKSANVAKPVSTSAADNSFLPQNLPSSFPPSTMLHPSTQHRQPPFPSEFPQFSPNLKWRNPFLATVPSSGIPLRPYNSLNPFSSLQVQSQPTAGGPFATAPLPSHQMPSNAASSIAQNAIFSTRPASTHTNPFHQPNTTVGSSTFSNPPWSSQFTDNFGAFPPTGHVPLNGNAADVHGGSFGLQRAAPPVSDRGSSDFAPFGH